MFTCVLEYICHVIVTESRFAECLLSRVTWFLDLATDHADIQFLIAMTLRYFHAKCEQNYGGKEKNRDRNLYI